MMGMVACEADQSDLGIMQVNPQGSVMSADGVTVAFGSDIAGQALNLNDFAGKTVKVIDVTKAELPEGAELGTIVMQVSPDADFANTTNLTVTNGAVDADRWIDYLRTVYPNNPSAKPCYVRFQIPVMDGSSVAFAGGQYMAAKQLDVTSYILIEESYYLVGSYLGDNKIDQAVKMDRSERDRYEDPVFSKLVDVTDAQAAAGYTWRVVPESQLHAAGYTHCFGVADPAATNGDLVEGGEAAVIKTAGGRKIEVNMQYKTYSVTYTFDYLYTPGPANGWGFEDNMLLYTNNYVNYEGFVYIDSMFKFAANASWDLNWGTNDAAGAGNLVAGGDNITVEKNGLYWVTADMTKMTYALTEITNISLIGGFNGWGGDLELTPSDDFKTWTGTLSLTEESEWKFRMNHDWAINLGGAPDKLEVNGGNLKNAAGTYTVTLELGSLPYKCTVTPKK